MTRLHLIPCQPEGTQAALVGASGDLANAVGSKVVLANGLHSLYNLFSYKRAKLLVSCKDVGRKSLTFVRISSLSPAKQSLANCVSLLLGVQNDSDTLRRNQFVVVWPMLHQSSHSSMVQILHKVQW